MSIASTPCEMFSRCVKDSRTSDSDLAALARFILRESVGGKDSSTAADSAEQRNRDVAEKAKKALILLRLWADGCVENPLTLRVLLDALLEGWANMFIEAALEKEIVNALLALDKERGKGQVGEALRQCGKDHLFYQPSKLLSILAGANAKHNETVVRWASTTLARMIPVDHVRFVAQCLLAAGGEKNNPPLLENAAKHHIEEAAKTLAIVTERLRFTVNKPCVYKPMDERIRLLNAAKVECSWITSNMSDLATTEHQVNEWLNYAEEKVNSNLGEQSGRTFEVTLAVRIYPHVKEWFERREKLVPIKTILRSV